MKRTRSFDTLWSGAYFVLLVYFVFFSARRRHPNVPGRILNIIPLRGTLHNYYTRSDFGLWNFYSNLFGNIALFIPIPFILISLFKVKSNITIVISAFFLSVLIELLQYIFKRGVADVDDVILNTLGGVMGVVLGRMLGVSNDE